MFVSRDELIYVDFDLQFSSLLQNLDSASYEGLTKSGKLKVLQPSEDILDFAEGISGQEMQSGGALILDSLNSLQSLLTDEASNRGSKIANQKTALIVTVLQKMCRFYSKSLVIVNVTRSRPKNSNEESSSFWEKKLVGGRMIKFKSDVILSVKQILSAPPEIEIKVQESHGESLSILPKDQRFLLRL